MHVLAVDTATNSGGVAVGRNEEVIGVIMLKTPLSYQEKIIDLVDFLLDQHGLSLADVGCIATASGPGSFTGLRIGLATVKAFAQSLSRPALGISTLEALAYRYRWAHPRVAPLIDARRQQVFGAVYGLERDSWKELVPQQVRRPDEFLQQLPAGSYLFVGDGAHLYRETVLALRPESQVLETDNFLLDSLCRIAYRLMIGGRSGSAEALKANYVRPSDAELQRLS